MDLITPLAAGMAGCEDGRAELYIRGTSTRATWYTDFEGTTPVATGANITLDGSGRAVVYVNRLVTVVVRDSSGTLQATFTAGHAASAVEYQGQGFTGANYTTAASGTGSGYPTTVQAVLDAALDSFGAADWEVLFNGTATPIQNAVSVLSEFFYPQSPEFGALADGVNDDTAALQACLTAAGDAGGGTVVLGVGAYRITSALTVPTGVSIWGSGRSEASGISVDHASNGALAFAASGGAYVPSEVVGVTIEAAQANTSNLITLGAATSVRFDRCTLGSNLHTGVVIANNASSTVTLNHCLMDRSGSTANLVTGGTVYATQTRFAPQGTSVAPTNGFIYAAAMYLDRCTFASTATSGTFSYIAFNSTTVTGNVSNCTFGNAAGATVTAMTFGSYAAASDFHENGNHFGSSITAYSYTPGTSTYSTTFELGTRRSRVYTAGISAAVVSLPVQQYGVIDVASTYAGNVSLGFDGHLPNGAQVAIVVVNDEGTNRDFTISTIPAALGTATITASGGRNGILITAVGSNGAFADQKYYIGNWNV